MCDIHKSKKYSFSAFFLLGLARYGDSLFCAPHCPPWVAADPNHRSKYAPRSAESAVTLFTLHSIQEGNTITSPGANSLASADENAVV